MTKTAYFIDHDRFGVVEVEVLRDVYDGVAFDVQVIGAQRKMRPYYIETDGKTGKTFSAGIDLLVFHDQFPVCDDEGGFPAMDEAKRRMAMKIGYAALVE